MDETGAPPPAGTLREAGATLLRLLGTRVELVGVELREEAHRAQRLVVLAIVGAFLLGAGLVMAGLFVLVAFWESHRLLAAAGLALLYGGAGIAVLAYLRDTIARGPKPFSATVTEIAADLEMLGTPGAERR